MAMQAGIGTIRYTFFSQAGRLDGITGRTGTHTHYQPRHIPCIRTAHEPMDKADSSVCELTGYPLEKITKDKLYDISKHLYTCLFYTSDRCRRIERCRSRW